MNKISLQNIKWLEFYIDEIFEITRGDAKKVTMRDLNFFGKESIPIISSKNGNNGLLGFTIKDEKETSFKNVITLNNNGSVGYSYYHGYEFIASSDVTILKLKEDRLNKYTAKFIITCLQKIAIDKFGYGYKASNERLKKTKLLLPVNNNNLPDWIFMEKYIKNLQDKQIKNITEHFKNKIGGVTYKVIKPLHSLEWGQFYIKDVFQIEKCKCSKVNSLISGDVPYVGATNRNNGVLSFVKGDKKLITKGNCIAFICDGEGSIGYSIYKKENFIGSTTIKVGRSENLNSYVGKFISTVADRARSRYNFGFKRNEQHLKNEILSLPVHNNGTINWRYMHDFCKNLEFKQIYYLLKYYCNN